MKTRISALSKITIAAIAFLPLCATTAHAGKAGETAGKSAFMAANVDREKFAPLHFGFESDSLTAVQESELDKVADFAKGAPNTIIIAGFTDECGTDGYDRDLGLRRAEAVKYYLVHRGVKAARLKVVSFGKEMPAAKARNDAAWKTNRRVEFGVAG